MGCGGRPQGPVDDRVAARPCGAVVGLGFEGEWLLPCLVDWYLAVADWLRGRVVGAEQALTGLVAQLQAAGARYLARLCYDLGQVQRARGHLGAAFGTYQRLLVAAAASASRPYRRRASPTWAWRRCCTTAASWTPPWSMPPNSSECPGSSAGPGSLGPAWPSWPRSGTPGRPGRCPGGGRRGPAGRAEPRRGRLAQPPAGGAGAAGAGPRRGRLLDESAWPACRRPAELSPGARVPGAGPSTAGPGPARPGPRAPGPAATPVSSEASRAITMATAAASAHSGSPASATSRPSITSTIAASLWDASSPS
jgi:hypothetical protein